MGVSATVCPHCQVKLKIQAQSHHRAITCPKCHSEFVPKDSQVACLKCKTVLPVGSVLCVNCGFDFRTKKNITGTFQAAKKEKRKIEERGAAATSTSTMDKPTWGEILSSPFNVEMVLAESVILTMWGVVWDLLFISVITGIFMAMGGFGLRAIFSAAALIAGLIRIWMLTSDVSLKTVLTLSAGLLAFAGSVGWIANLVNPNFDSVEIAFFVFISMVLILIMLRCLSFFFGRYFALLRRAALRKSMSGADRGGLVDLGHALILSIMAFFPFFIIWGIDVYFAIQQQDFPGGWWMFMILSGITLCWAYFYQPMAVAVVSLRGSFNPAIVIKWIGKCFVDYITLLVCFFPFHVAIWAGKLALSEAINQVFQFDVLTAAILFIVNMFILSVLLDHYALAATLVSLGLVMRRNEDILHWQRRAEIIAAERD